MAKATITKVTVDNSINTAYVIYSTGTEKVYPADKLPKTVQAWVEKNSQKEPEVEEPEEPEATEEPAEEVTEEPELPVPLLEVTPEPAQEEPAPEVITPEPRQTHTEPRRAVQKKQVKTLSLDIVEATITALLMLSRVSLMALAYLLTGMAAAVRAGIDAYEWLTPRTAALIEHATAAYHTTVRPACRAALVWTAEAIWYILI